jgi:hypothetical protein
VNKQNTDRFFVQTPDSSSIHYEAIGRFIDAFSTLEIALHKKLHQLIGAPPEVTKVITSTQDIPVLLGSIQSIATARNASAQAISLYVAIRQTIEALWKIRAKIAHQPFMRTDTEFRFSNAFWAKNAESVSNYECTIDQLMAASEFIPNLGTAIIFLDFHTGELSFPGEIKDLILKSLRKKHPLPEKVNPRSQDDHVQLPLIQRLASPA